jgi:hypothetical protein
VKGFTIPSIAILPDCLVEPELAKKGRSYERNQYCLWARYRDLHDPAAPIDAQADTAER